MATRWNQVCRKWKGFGKCQRTLMCFSSPCTMRIECPTNRKLFVRQGRNWTSASAIALDSLQAFLFAGRQGGEQVALLTASNHYSIIHTNIWSLHKTQIVPSTPSVWFFHDLISLITFIIIVPLKGLDNFSRLCVEPNNVLLLFNAIKMREEELP